MFSSPFSFLFSKITLLKSEHKRHTQKKNVSTFTMGLCFSTQDWTNRTLLPKTCFLELYSRPDPYELLVKNPY